MLHPVNQAPPVLQPTEKPVVSLQQSISLGIPSVAAPIINVPVQAPVAAVVTQPFPGIKINLKPKYLNFCIKLLCCSRYRSSRH